MSIAMPKVSVLVITYNHERYIEQAVNSALAQRTEFDYEIIIGEDFSTDNTREIVEAYSKKYPDKIRCVLSRENFGEAANIAQTLAECRGQYVSLLDGDDIFSSTEKLQRQSDFLDERPEFAMAFHNVLAFHEDGSQAPYQFNSVDQKTSTTLDDLWTGCYIATCSAMFRRDLVSQVPSWFRHMTWGDWPLYILIAQHGAIGYLNEVLGSYRIHKNGAWSGLSEIEQFNGAIKFYEAMNTNLNFMYDAVIQDMISKHYSHLAFLYEKNGKPQKAESCRAQLPPTMSRGNRSANWLVRLISRGIRLNPDRI